MSNRVEISRRAARDLASAAAWWAENRSANEAVRWYDGFIAKLQELAVDPLSYPPADEGGLGADIRQVNYGLSSKPTHRALFTVVSPDRVVVLAIRHLARGPIDPGDVSP